MSNYLGHHFQAERERRGWRLGDLARILGYRNINKGSNRVKRFEQEGKIKEDLLLKLMGALGIEPSVVDELLVKERAEWEKWADEPVPMQLVIRIMPAIYSRHPIPEDITTPESAESYARAIARKKRMMACLVVSRRLSVWIDAEGNVYDRTEAQPNRSNQPWMAIGGKQFVLKCEEAK
jgi:transcriptional regulator with XRE-family HTH domain